MRIGLRPLHQNGAARLIEVEEDYPELDDDWDPDQWNRVSHAYGELFTKKISPAWNEKMSLSFP